MQSVGIADLLLLIAGSIAVIISGCLTFADIIKVSDLIMIVAVVVSPFLAVHVQKRLEQASERRNRKLQVFKALMANRGAPLSPLHVESLNMIDVEFYGESRKDKKVISAWKEYQD
jgi:hypothetical protein